MTRSGETLIFENIWNVFLGLFSSFSYCCYLLLLPFSNCFSLNHFFRLYYFYYFTLDYLLPNAVTFGQENLGKNSPFKVILNWIQNQADAYLSLDILMTSVLTTIYLQFSKSYKTIPVGAIHKVRTLKISKVKNPPPTPYSIHLNTFDIILAFHLVHA